MHLISYSTQHQFKRIYRQLVPRPNELLVAAMSKGCNIHSTTNMKRIMTLGWQTRPNYRSTYELKYIDLDVLPIMKDHF